LAQAVEVQLYLVLAVLVLEKVHLLLTLKFGSALAGATGFARAGFD